MTPNNDSEISPSPSVPLPEGEGCKALLPPGGATDIVARAPPTRPWRGTTIPGHCIIVVRVPIGVPVISTRSPGRSHNRGLRAAPIPPGVPVRIASPGSSVMTCDR